MRKIEETADKTRATNEAIVAVAGFPDTVRVCVDKLQEGLVFQEKMWILSPLCDFSLNPVRLEG